MEQVREENQKKRESGEFIPDYEKATSAGVLLYKLYKEGERDVETMKKLLQKKQKGVEWNRNLICAEITQTAREVFEDDSIFPLGI